MRPTSSDAHSFTISWLEPEVEAPSPVLRKKCIGDSAPHWVAHSIPGVKLQELHDLQTGYFTQNGTAEIMAVSKHKDSPRPILVYRPETFNADGSPDTWVSAPFENEFRSIRDIHVIRSGVDGQDRLLFASREGISVVWFDGQTQNWCSSNVGSGKILTSESEAEPFKFQGSDGVATGSLGDDPVGFIASTEGNLVSVYVKRAETRKDLVVTSVNWRRFVIDQFESNTGDWAPLVPDHKPTLRVECGNFDGSGVDCILVSAQTGHEPGLYLYKPTDLERGIFSKFKIVDGPTGPLVLDDFRLTGTLDIINTLPSPVRTTKLGQSLKMLANRTLCTKHSIDVDLVDDTVNIRVPRVLNAAHIDELAIVELAGRRISLVVLPPYKAYELSPGDGIKILNGKLVWFVNNQCQSRGVALEPFKRESLIPNADDNMLFTHAHGAIFLRLAESTRSGTPPFKHMNQIETFNLLPPHISQAARDKHWIWSLVKDMFWALNATPWPFYTFPGFHITYKDESIEHVCHVQCWTLGVNRTVMFHTHKSFCELQAYIVNGTGEGGWWSKNEESDKFIMNDPTILQEHILNKHTELLPCPDMAEHEPLWRQTKEGYPLLGENGMITYPMHASLSGKSSDWDDSNPDQPETLRDEERFDIWLSLEFPFAAFQYTENRGLSWEWRIVKLRPRVYKILGHGETEENFREFLNEPVY